MRDTGPLRDFLERHPRVLVLSGAGCSTASGIPDYRDAIGGWKQRPPVLFADFAGSAAVRRRYWARSLVGFPRIAGALPNAAHQGLARMEQAGRLEKLVTQNVDGLHQKAGSRDVIDLHGRLDRVACLACGATLARADVQLLLLDWNPDYAALTAEDAPDGDARLEGGIDDFRVPECPECGGILKPDVVFFGENVPRPRVLAALAALHAADALLVVGSSLAVYSGYRFALAAHQANKPIAAINLGRTRADALFSLKLETDCAQLLGTLQQLTPASP